MKVEPGFWIEAHNLSQGFVISQPLFFAQNTRKIRLEKGRIASQQTMVVVVVVKQVETL